MRLAEKGSPSLQAVLAERGQPAKARDSTEETITQRKKPQNFIIPSKGLMPGNEWSPCPPPLGDKQNSAG